MIELGAPHLIERAGLGVSLACLLGAGGCQRVVSGVEPEALGYGPGSQASLAVGYDPDPVPRPSPQPWAAPEREAARAAPGASGPASSPAGLGPKKPAPSVDVVRVCQHVVAIAAKDAPVDAEDCLRSYQIGQVFRTLPDWKTFAACVEAAKDPAAIETCEQATPRAFTEVEDRVREAYSAELLQRANQAAFDEMRAYFDIAVQWEADADPEPWP